MWPGHWVVLTGETMEVHISYKFKLFFTQLSKKNGRVMGERPHCFGITVTAQSVSSLPTAFMKQEANSPPPLKEPPMQIFSVTSLESTCVSSSRSSPSRYRTVKAWTLERSPQRRKASIKRKQFLTLNFTQRPSSLIWASGRISQATALRPWAPPNPSPDYVPLSQDPHLPERVRSLTPQVEA